jgi:hypothetical protein
MNTPARSVVTLQEPAPDCKEICEGRFGRYDAGRVRVRGGVAWFDARVPQEGGVAPKRYPRARTREKSQRAPWKHIERLTRRGVELAREPKDFSRGEWHSEMNVSPGVRQRPKRRGSEAQCGWGGDRRQEGAEEGADPPGGWQRGVPTDCRPRLRMRLTPASLATVRGDPGRPGVSPACGVRLSGPGPRRVSEHPMHQSVEEAYRRSGLARGRAPARMLLATSPDSFRHF